MWGYIYRTTNNKTGEVYIGRKNSSHFIPTYYGAGTYIRKWIDEHGTDDLTVTLLLIGESNEQLDMLEISTIATYKALYGDLCVNKAKGGSMGDFFHYFSPTDMDEFKRKTGERMRNLYKDPEERRKQSERITKAWSDPELRKKQGDRVREQWKRGDRNMDKLNKSCVFYLGNERRVFKSCKALKKFLKTEYGTVFANPDLKKMLDSGKPYHPYHKKKKAALDGMVLRWNEFFVLKRRDS